MDFHAIVQNDSPDKLKCFKCKRFLSYFPISVCSESLESCCGRCVSPEGTSYIQNAAFEHLAQHLYFPCQYSTEGCAMEIRPRDVPQHEDTCVFRPIPCSIDVECAWTGLQSNLINHCQSEHQDKFLENGIFHVDFAKGPKLNSSRYFLVMDEILYIFDVEFNEKTALLSCSLFTHQLESKLNTFQCQISAKIDNKCVLLTLNSTTFDDRKFSTISLEPLRSPEKSIIACHIFKEQSVRSGRLDQETMISDILLALKCSACEEFATPPILECRNAMFCWECWESHNRACNTCTKFNAPPISFKLNTLVGLLDYPCKNKGNGCTYVSKPKQIKNHESVCDLKTFVCPVNEYKCCRWEGLLKNMQTHIENDHQEVVRNSTQFIKQLTHLNPKCDFIRFGTRIFMLVCTKRTDCFLWSVQLISADKSNSFIYEIEIVEARNGRRRILMSQKCQPLTPKAHIFDSNSLFCCLREDQMCDFLDDDSYITFGVRIFDSK